MKKFLLAVLLIVSVFLVGCDKNADLSGEKIPEQSENSSVLDSSNDGETSTEDGEVVEYKITYQWDEYGKLYDGIELFPEEMTKGLNFPQEYVEGKTLVLPKLNMWKKNSKLTYEFEGWYYDAELKNKVLDEVLPATIIGDITLYAKVAAYVN